MAKLTENSNSFSEKVTPDFNSMIKILFWNSMGFFFFNFMVPYVTGQLMDASGTQLGFMFSAFTIGAIISTPLVGYFTDRSSKKNLVLFGSIGRGISYIWMYITILFRSLIGFTGSMLFLGMSVGVFWPPFNALVSEKSNKENRSTAFGKSYGKMGIGNLVGACIGVPIFVVIDNFFPGLEFIQYSPLLLYAISNFYAGIYFSKNVDEDLTYDRFLNSEVESLPQQNMEKLSNNEEDVKEFLKSEPSKEPFFKNMPKGLAFGLLLMILGMFFANMNESMAYPFLQAYLTANIQDNATIIMLIYFPSGILTLIISPKIGELCDKINLPLGVALSSFLGALTTFFLIRTDSEILFSLLLIIDSTLATAGGLILQNVMSRVNKTNRGKLFGLQGWLGRLGGVLGPIIGGLAWDKFGTQSPFIISIFVELALIPIFILTLKTLEPVMEEKISKK
ncbi:hypothetical protein NEF87_001547 [Candidatus Lokiarchaeum ossiferum]|uniref:Major facilitator superfamily (MFS) profile domain-containing protein n=1 Tax=Candidatus Lokiarchaeum ossiferum TaxID=2951803 RepID=A0ABY6HSA6_9ARCH|nr:hypothetical protein NEF87_001547 [Candidatus Lokiarchaeum sp. B-35]